MGERFEYSFQDYWADLRSVNQVRKSWGLIPSFDENVKNHFEKIHGVNYLTTWRYGKFMLTNIYIIANKDALGIGELGVAGDYDMLLSDKLAGRVLKYAVEHDLATIPQFPPPEFFLNHVSE
jgi:hypothetical protein